MVHGPVVCETALVHRGKTVAHLDAQRRRRRPEPAHVVDGDGASLGGSARPDHDPAGGRLDGGDEHALAGRQVAEPLVLADGEPAPAGAALTLLGDGKEFFVARRGEAFVTGLQPRNVLRLRWGEQTCDMDIALPPGSPDDIARVGPVVCQGVQR